MALCTVCVSERPCARVNTIGFSAVASALLETPEFAPQPPAAITVGRTSAAAKMRAMFFFIAFVLLFLFYFNLNYIPIISNTSNEIIT